MGLHIINSALLKLGKLLKACNVYRGMQGGRLPEAFQKANMYNVRGGVEYGFMSTTTDRDVALQYARSGDEMSMVLQMQLGMVDRGADLSWLSQYPLEREICFSPLTSLEVQATSVESSVLLVDVRININLIALTIEQVVAKRKRIIETMVENTLVEAKSFFSTWGTELALFQA